MWESIIGGLAGMVTSIVGFVVSGKDKQKQEIVQIMNEYVYNRGYSLDQVYQMYPQLYAKNEKFFEKQYYIAKEERDYNQSNRHKVLSETKTVLFVVVIALMVYLATE